jgi:hypothetical protein
MENKLKNLRSSMDQTVLKDGRMSSTEKQRIIMHALNNASAKRNRNLIGPLLSVAATMIFFFSFGSFTYYKLMPDKTSSSDSSTTAPTRETVEIVNENDQSKQESSEKVWRDVTVLEPGANYDMPTNARDYIASANRSIHTSPAPDSKLIERGFDEMYYYYLEAMALQNGLNIIKVEGTDIEKDFNNLYNLSMLIQEEQGKRLDGVNIEGVSKFDAHNYWKEPTEEMEQSLLYLQNLLNDLDSIMNHDGKRKLFGYSYQADGNKTDELQKFIDDYFGF